MPRTHRMRTVRTQLLVALSVLLTMTTLASAQWQLGSASGDTLRLGYLVQMRGEWEAPEGAGPSSRNLFLRHVRLLLSGKTHHSIGFFLGTDSPNLGKTQSDGTKNNGSIGIYDVWLTYDARNAFKVDMGLIGTPNSHNSIQSISGMLTTDFGPYSFVSTPPTGSKAGRDYGAQARGYMLGDHVEYRAGIFQGFRGVGASMPFRYGGRVVLDAFQVEKSVYYAGTSLGTRRNLALGVSADGQGDYRGIGGDLYSDFPLLNGDGITFQADVVRYNGGATFPTFQRQVTSLVEVGYFSKASRLAPFIQIARLDFAGTAFDERESVGGLAYFVVGHSLNAKAMYGKSWVTGMPGKRIFQLTLQSLEF